MSEQTYGSELARHLSDQLEWQWTTALRPRLEGLGDDEYRWEPVAGCWNVRPRSENPPLGNGTVGDWVIDFAFPQPDPAPVTTIAWRIAHIVVGVFGARNHSHFGGPPVDYDTFPYAGTAAEALAQLDEHYDRWITGVKALDDEALWRPVGPAEGAFAEAPMTDLVLHIHREAIHHGAEIALLRDLYAHRPLIG